MKNAIVAILLVMLYGCSITSQVSGSHVSLNTAGNKLQVIQSDEVTIFLQTPEHAHQTIALLSASATISGYSNVAAMEAELLEELRRQAASIGANGVMDITREVMIGDKVITTNTWGIAAGSKFETAEQNKLKHTIVDRRDRSVVTSDYLLIYRGKAISHEK